ncbi:hypothetical protein [Streptosporangium sp. NPDC006007]|uniref:hypothetical protein n=1 Tax=Streptosporangium sp. NPDC006007 TaxID=3154575 RepID=UPI0033A61B51
MTSEVVHLIVRIGPDDRDLYMTSPQAPGLMYGRPTLKELRAGLQDVLSFHLERPGPFEVVEHHERHYDIADGELVTRLACDQHVKARQAAYAALGRAIQDPDQARGLVSAPTNAVGEVVYICGVMSDTIGWIMEQLDSRGDTANVIVSVADSMVVTMPFAYAQDHEDMVSIANKSYTLETTLSEVVRNIQIVTSTAVAPARAYT